MWSLAESELGFEKVGLVNIGWLCSDRICNDGEGKKIALFYEKFDGYKRKYSFDELRLASNTFAGFLNYLGIKDGDRICLYLDRYPNCILLSLAYLKLEQLFSHYFLLSVPNH